MKINFAFSFSLLSFFFFSLKNNRIVNITLKYFLFFALENLDKILIFLYFLFGFHFGE